jgi:hypothetical protein
MVTQVAGTEGLVEIRPMIGPVVSIVAPVGSSVFLSEQGASDGRNNRENSADERDASSRQYHHGLCS